MMPRTVEHIVETHKIAQERRASGRPVWDENIQLDGLFDDDDLSFEEKRDRFAVKLKASRWFRRNGEDSEIGALWDEIKDAETVEHFDAVLDAIYDEADYDRIWIH